MCDSQPTYDDMGKICKDFVKKGYYINVFHLKAKKPKTFPYVETNISCLHNFEDNTAVCDFEKKFMYPAWGLTTSAKIDTKNLLSWKADICDKITRGLKLSAESSFNIDSSEKNAKFNAMYKIPIATFDLGLQGGEGEDGNLTVNGSVVAGYPIPSYGKILGGYQAAFDTNEGALKKNNVALGFAGKDLNIHGNLDNAETISGVIHYKCTNNMEAAIDGTYNSADETKTVYGLGLKFLASPCTSFKAKIDSNRTITMACEMKVTDATALTLCAQCDKEGAGKVGCALEFGQ